MKIQKQVHCKIISFKIKSISYLDLKCFQKNIRNIIPHLGKQVIVFNFVPLPNKIKRLTLFKSPHVHKKAKVQFELITYRSLVKIKINVSNTKMNLKQHLLKNLLINKPKSVHLSFCLS
jgi:ribosomal protein S10